MKVLGGKASALGRFHWGLGKCIAPQGKKKENSVHTTRACRGSVILLEAGTNVCSRAHLAFLLKLDAARSAVSKDRHFDLERILVMMCAIMGTSESLLSSPQSDA